MANRINLVFTADTSKLQASLQGAVKSLDKFSKQATELGSTLSQNLSLPIVGIGAAAVKSFVDIDKLERGMVAIMGSSEGAAAELEKLKETAKLPGIGFEEAVQGSVNLQAVGLSADEARSTLNGFAAALAATGKGRVELEAIQYQLTQMISKNKLLAEDYKVIQSNLPLMAAGLEKAFGTNNIEKIRETGISAKEFTLRLSEALGTLPQVEKATGGLGNAFDNFGDSVKFSLGQLGKTIAASLNLEGILDFLSKSLAGIVGWFTDLSPGLQKAIVLIAALAAGVGPVLFAFGKLSASLKVMQAGLALLGGPVALVIGGLALLAIAVNSASTKLSAAAAAQKKIADVSKVAQEAFAEESSEVRRLVDVIKDETIERESKLKAVNQLKQIAPSYFGNISTERDLVVQTTSAYKAYSEELLKAAKVQAAKQQLVEVEKALLNVVEASKPNVWQQIGNAFSSALNPFYAGIANAETFGKNVKDNTRNLNAQRDALVNLLNELDKPVSPKTGGFAGGAIPGSGSAAAKEDLKQSEADLLEYEKFVSNINSRISGLIQTAVSPFTSTRSALIDLTNETPKINEQRDAILAYQEAVAIAAEQAAFFGTSEIDAKLNATKTALDSAIESFGIHSEAVKFLKADYDALNITVAEQNALQERQAQYLSTISEAFDTAAKSMEQSGNTIKTVLASVAKAALSAASDFIKAKVKEAIAAFIADNFKKFGLLGAVTAAGGAALVGSLFQGAINKVSGIKLASGGLAYGPTLATVGDNPSAISDPEVIAPLSKLKDYLNQGAGYIAEARISGSDLLILVSNAERREGRIR